MLQLILRMWACTQNARLSNTFEDFPTTFRFVCALALLVIGKDHGQLLIESALHSLHSLHPV